MDDSGREEQQAGRPTTPLVLVYVGQSAGRRGVPLAEAAVAVPLVLVALSVHCRAHLHCPKCDVGWLGTGVAGRHLAGCKGVPGPLQVSDRSRTIPGVTAKRPGWCFRCMTEVGETEGGVGLSRFLSLFLDPRLCTERP